MNKNNNPHVCILMSTYNGGKFLAEQLTSIESQTYSNWRLVISDDGSSDNTLIIAKQFQEKWGNSRLEIRQGPQLGFCQNFLSMACDLKIRADLYAFSDQDDVWLLDKISRAVAYFNESNEFEIPIAYGSRTQIVDEELNPIGFSPEFTLPRSFRNAIVQSIAGGNTQLFNQAAKELLEKSGIQQVVSHDWWLYQIVKGVGGIFYYDPKPSLLYRQHANSLIGGNQTFKGKMDRILYVLNGRFKDWNDINYAALYNIRYLLTRDSQDILKIFGEFRNAKLKDRIRLLEVCGLYRQTWRSTLNLWIATLFNKI